MNRFPMVLFALILLAGCAMLALPTPVHAASCDRGSCNATITTSVELGGRIQCQEPPKIKIEVAISCPGQCTTSRTFYTCSTSSDPIQFSECGVTHVVSLTSGTWEDALTDCSLIAYSAQ